MCTSNPKALGDTPPLGYLQEMEKLSAPSLLPPPPWIMRGENMSLTLVTIVIVIIALLAVLGI